MRDADFPEQASCCQLSSSKPDVIDSCVFRRTWFVYLILTSNPFGLKTVCVYLQACSSGISNSRGDAGVARRPELQQKQRIRHSHRGWFYGHTVIFMLRILASTALRICCAGQNESGKYFINCYGKNYVQTPIVQSTTFSYSIEKQPPKGCMQLWTASSSVTFSRGCAICHLPPDQDGGPHARPARRANDPLGCKAASINPSTDPSAYRSSSSAAQPVCSALCL